GGGADPHRCGAHCAETSGCAQQCDWIAKSLGRRVGHGVLVTQRMLVRGRSKLGSRAHMIMDGYVSKASTTKSRAPRRYVQRGVGNGQALQERCSVTMAATCLERCANSLFQPGSCSKR